MYMDRIYVKQQARTTAAERKLDAARCSMLGLPPGCAHSAWLGPPCPALSDLLPPPLCPNTKQHKPRCTSWARTCCSHALSSFPSHSFPEPAQNKTTVHQLGLDLWRDVVVRNRRIRSRLLEMLLDMVQASCPFLVLGCFAVGSCGWMLGMVLDMVQVSVAG